MAVQLVSCGMLSPGLVQDCTHGIRYNQNFMCKDELISDVLLWTPTHGHTNDRIKEEFFQDVSVSVLLYVYTTWT